MKKIFQIIAIVLLQASLFSSCSLEEWNPATVDLETAYKYKDGYESLINFCYNGLYYYYGKVDGIGPMEMGTDSWSNFGTNQTDFILYDSKMNTQQTPRKMWDGLYATINFCNMAIHYAKTVEGYTGNELDEKVAEAYFLRAWSYWHLVEQFGGVVLRTEPSTVTGPDNFPKRSSEQEFYDLIISDLEFACEHLPLSQPERGRASQKAAYAMMAKACLQRTRLGEKETYAKKALDAAEELINNQAKYGVALYKSDANQSGFSKLWDGANNKNNSEFIFLEAVDHIDGLNPEGWNRGRTRQYYVMDCRNAPATDWGTQEQDFRLSRTNTTYYKPTKYLLTSIFPPVANPADTRFAETFFYEYYPIRDVTITQTVIDKYHKNPALLGHVIPNTNGAFHTLTHGGATIGGGTGNSVMSGQVNMDINSYGYPNGLCIYTPNWNMTAEEKRDLPFWVVDPSDMFDASGKWITVETNPDLGGIIRNIFPSLKKFACPEYIDTNVQQWMGDIPIIRMGEVYLIAAEAALLYNNDQSKALQYVNEVRKRAAVTGRENEMLASQGEMTIDYILAERGRELCGEQVRWYDLKRMGKLTTTYLRTTNPEILSFDETKNLVRPIPQSFLDAISNPEEFGTNGY